MIVSLRSLTRRLPRSAPFLRRTPHGLLTLQTVCVAAAMTLAIFVVAVPHQASWFATASVITVLSLATWQLRTVAGTWHALDSGRRTLQTEAKRRTVSEARQELLSGQKTNQWLHRLASHTDFPQALTEVMRQLVPRTGGGFVAWLDCSSQPSRITHCRGLSPESKQRLRFDDDWREATIPNQSRTLRGAELYDNSLYDALTREERRGVAAVHLFALPSPLGGGILLTSELLPVEQPQENTSEIIFGLQRHLIGEASSDSDPCETPSPQLQRVSSDASVTTTLDVLDDFLDELRRVTEVDRVGLVIGNVAVEGHSIAVAESSRELPPNVLAEWSQIEQLICHQFGTASRFQVVRTHHDPIVSLDSTTLLKIGVDVLIGQAWIVPIQFERRSLGLLCLTHQRTHSLSEKQHRWAVGCAACIADLLQGLRSQQSPGLNDHQVVLDVEPSAQLANLDFVDTDDEQPLRPDELAVLSHEVRNPMNGVLSMVRLALQTDLTAEQREYLDIVRVSSESLLETVNGVLEHAGNPATDSTNSEVNLDQLLTEVLRTFAAKAAEQGIELVGHRPLSVPESIHVDRRRLRQVLINLVANAVKFTSVGEVYLAVSMSEDHHDRQLRYTVRDTGIGIPLDKQKRIFEPYVQAEDDTKARFGGTGLGLAVSRDLVREMGGELTLQSQLGHGTTFEFSLPTDGPTFMPQKTGGPRGTVLVQIENETLRRDLTETLKADGWDFRSPPDQPFTWAIIEASNAVAPTDLNAANRMLLRNPNTRCSETDGAITLLKPVLPTFIVNQLRTDHSKPESPSQTSLVQSPPTKKLETDEYWPEGLEILVADDDPVNQHVSRLVLDHAGCQVAVVDSGEAAALAFTEATFDVVILDRKMTGIDGYETAKLLRKHEKQTHRTPALIVLLSGFVGPEERTTASASGIDECLEKPLDETRIRALLAARFPKTRTEPSTAPPDLTPKMARLLQCKLAEDWPQLKVAIQTQDFSLWEDKAHTLKGAVSCIRWDALEQLLHKLEVQARKKIPDQPSNELKEIDRLIDTFIANLPPELMKTTTPD